MPVVMVGSLGYKISSDILYRQIEESETAQIEGLSNKVSRFMSDRYIDIQALATVNTFSQAQLRNSLSPQDKQKVLDRYANIYQFYDSIAVFDLKGDVIAQSQGTPLKNHGDRSYFKDVINTKSAVISQPLISTTEGTFNIYFAAPVKDSQTGEIIGVIRSRMPVKNLQKVIKQEGDHASHENKEDIY